MARFPGTETPVNRAGLRPGQAVRCRRCQANADLGLADRQGLVLQVRPAHARVLAAPAGPAHWLANEALVPLEALADPELALLGHLMQALHAERLDFDEGELLFAGPGLPASALDEARAALGPRLLDAHLTPEGVHELGVRLRVAGWPGPGA